MNFADTDIREVVSQILGTTLGQTYTIDPAVHGTATLRTSQPLSREQLLPVLQTLLAQNGAALVQSNGIYRVLPAAAAGGISGLAGDGGGSTALVPLRYAGAEDLAKVLQPFVQNGGRISADAGRNALIVVGDPATRQTLTSLIQAFDIDTLAGQSYALLPVTSGDAKDFASAMQDAVRGAGASLSGVVRVIPMARIDSVLVVSSQPRYIEEVRRIYGLVERKRRQTIRSWHVYYLQNSRSNDTAYVLQQAFTPDNVTAVPTPASAPQQAGLGSQTGTGMGTGVAAARSGIGSSGGAGGLSSSGSPSGLSSAGSAPAPTAAPVAPVSGNPLLGGLDPSEGGGGGTANGMRIIPNGQNNAVLIYATPQENDTVETMLRKLDILPLQVRIDATIAEVSLTDNLQYGTQFFFKSGLQGALSFGTTAAAFASGFPGFVLSGPNSTSAALSLLQSVTKVKVLSSPQLMVLDNQAARLEVGALVPYLSQTSQSTITSGSPVINSINYQQTGVIMQVTPRVNSGGLVTLDIAQEVSDVAQGVTTPGVNSPTFNQRSVTSRVVIQDGQTVGLAGLIQDSDSRQNEGIPWLKDIPLLGALAGQQNNGRSRTELLVLITPHVVQDQRDARSLTEDLRDQLRGAAAVPQQLNRLPQSGSADPNAEARRRLGLQQRDGSPLSMGQ
ncbi:type II secretion system secretin GspD [Acidisphaera sp. L21]|uniref:type II secretion system secretin GspD n=1 Tax=Acidisphaera sp. L21 TaxID=1641851 RepID=UPI0020B134A3|nr:type II secretion system secretin GspD [Acidisphaera sp. L21]